MTDFIEKYLLYCLALGASAFSSFLTLIIISKIPQTGIVIYFVFKEGAGIGEYLFLFVFLSIPALFTFWIALKHTKLKITFGSAIVLYIFGLITLICLIPMIARPENYTIGRISYLPCYSPHHWFCVDPVS